ncbi:hypothetical protein ACP70R_048820 [Stipagrostis hirtigluma subsp. patula]
MLLKKLKATAALCGSYVPYPQMYSLSSYLNMTPGIEAQAFCQISQVDRSTNDPNTKAIRMRECDSCESENKRPRVSAEKVTHAQNGSQNTLQSGHTSLVRPDQDNLHSSYASTDWVDPATLGTHRGPIRTFSRHSNASTADLEVATMDIHSNSLPITHMPMAHSQTMAATNNSGSSLPLFRDFLLLPTGAMAPGPLMAAGEENMQEWYLPQPLFG